MIAKNSLTSTVIATTFLLFFLDYLVPRDHYGADGLVIYRRKPKPKLVCHEEYMDDEIAQSSFSLGSTVVTASGVIDEKPVTVMANQRNKNEKKPPNENKNNNNNNNVNRIQKREAWNSTQNGVVKLLFKTSSPLPLSNSAVESNDITTVEPFIQLEKIDVGLASLDEEREAFEIVGENLTAEERVIIRRKLTQTCRALNLN